MTIVVTGATGNVGRPLVSELAAAGARVRAITRTPQTAKQALEQLAGLSGDAAANGADGGGNRKPRNSEFFAQSSLVDQTAGFERPGENRFLQFAVHGVRLRMGALRQVPPRRLRASETLRLVPLTC